MTAIVRVGSAVSRWGSDASTFMTRRYWGFFLAAFVLATGVAKRVYQSLDLPQTYSELTVGNIAWSFENKFHDYAVLYALVAGFLVALLTISAMAARLRKVEGADSVEHFHDFVLVLCIPSAMWFAQQLTTKSDSLGLLELSQALVLLGMVVFALLLSRRAAFWADRNGDLVRVAQHAVLFVVFSAFAVAAVGVASNRLLELLDSHPTHWMTSVLTAKKMRVAAECALVLCAVVTWITTSAVTLRRNMRRLAAAAQCFLPLLLLCVLPPAWISADAVGLSPGYPLTPFAKVLVLASLVAAFIELFVRARRVAIADASALGSLTVGSTVGLLLFLKTLPLGLPILSSDDYHFGELLVPWWSWAQMGQVPFWDYVPARGLINYVPGFFSALLFDGSPTSIAATYPFSYAAVSVLAVPVLRRSLGAGGAFVALLLGPYANSVSEIDIVVSVFLFALCWGWLHWSPLRWMAILALGGVALLLYAPGQAALAVLALSPLSVTALWRLYRTDRRRLLLLLAAIVGTLAIALALTPLGKMIFGALRYGAEQSKINSIAHGVNWSVSFGQVGFNPWAFELMRASFVLVALWAGVLVFKAVCHRSEPDRRRMLVYALPVLLISLLFVIRAAGRIDAGGSRLAIASVWALALLLPMLLFVSVRVRGVHFFVWAAVMGVLLPYTGSILSAGYAANFDPVASAPLAVNPNTRGLDHGRLGSAMADPTHLARIQAVRNVLDEVLEPSETYLDLTSRHAMYYYADRKPAIESAAVYNLVGERQQLRAVATIRAARFPAILLSAENVTHDGGPSSLRSNLVYREVLLSGGYKLVTVGQQVWMIRSDRVARLSPGRATSLFDLGDAAALPVLEPIFHQQDLRSIPSSWGRSAKSLEKELSPVVALPETVAVTLQGTRALGSGRYTVTGDDPWVRFDLSSSNVSGRQAAILSFDFDCDSPTALPGLGLYWTTPQQPEGALTYFAFWGHPGRVMIPVDSAPSWLLADRIQTLRLDLDTNVQGCETFSIRNVRLLARAATLR